MTKSTLSLLLDGDYSASYPELREMYTIGDLLDLNSAVKPTEHGVEFFKD